MLVLSTGQHSSFRKATQLSTLSGSPLWFRPIRVSGGASCFRAQRKSACNTRRLMIRAEGAIKDGELVSSEEDFQRLITDRKEPVVIDWMAKWCRKCIYLKPKLEKMIKAEFPGLELVFIDVNAIPGGLVYGHGIKKMPTITIHKGGEKVREHVAAEAAPRAISNVKSMISDYLELNPQEKELLASTS